ncbi:NADH-quinone oxidoreductase subunit M, partial [bacterium]|nr:NADH-quinone oxidoreductase subunit M [bacterium]
MTFVTDSILSWVTFLPLAGALLILLFARKDNIARVVALGVAIADFILSLHLWFHFDNTTAVDQFVELVP